MRRGAALGIGGVILFGLPESKDETASGAYADDGIVQRAIRAIRREVPGLLIVTDVCNCEYTSHGHCGKIVDGEVDNDQTLEWLAASAVSHARAGADIVAPSDMMDGRVAAIRHELDANGFSRIPILSTPPSSPRSSTGRSAKPPNPRRNSATAAATRWTPPTAAKPCAKSNSTWRRAPT
jgi:delta-aminolevulinic acid dehydratase/porphobilinogen synthase